jgi:hypothetical protein
MKAILGVTGLLLGISLAAAHAQTASRAPLVTVDNFIRAETDMYFAMFAKNGGFGTFNHARDLPLGDTGVRPNRDTFYSLAVFDLDAGPVTITLPDAGKRFMTMMVVDQDHYASMVTYGKGTHTLDRKAIGTRYVFAAVRILVDPADPRDIRQAHALQDAIKVSQKSVGKLETPNWDPASQKKSRDALLVLNETLPDLRRAGGRREEVDPVRHLVATASARGLNPEKDAIYLNVTPESDDGTTVYRLNVKDVPVDGFWSVTVYDETGNITAKRGADGSVAIQFGGCDGTMPNCLPTMKGWNYMVRLENRRSNPCCHLSRSSSERAESLGRGPRPARHRHAVDAVIWGMPAVNYDLMLQQMLTKTKAEINQFVYWSRPVDWKNQTRRESSHRPELLALLIVPVLTSEQARR